MATRVIRPPAQLRPREGSQDRRVSDAQSEGTGEISYEQLKSISIFKDVKYERIDLRALPETIVLRRFPAGYDICEQDYPGYTAFYVLTSDEVAALELPPLPTSAISAENALGVIRRVPIRTEPGENIDDTAHLGEGELFGEMSCLYRIPRSATVRTMRDCYVLEFLRNVLDKINTGSFRKHLDDLFRKRFLELHLRRLELFRNLNDADYLRLRDGAELLSLTPGQLMFDEHDRPDGLYIIRAGFIKIVKNVSALLGDSAILNWPRFLSALAAGKTETGARRKVWEHIEALLPPAGEEGTQWQRRELLFALNGLLKDKNFADKIGFAFVGPTEEWALRAKKLATAKKEDPSEIRNFNRQLFESLYSDQIALHGIEPPRVLAYRSAPEWVGSAATSAECPLIGEIGMLTGAPRTATCIAYGQSDDRYGGVQLVYINQNLYDQLLNQATPPAPERNQQRGQEVSVERTRQTELRLNLPVWQQESVNQNFEDLGLIQGQKLMLIDLDRCTRCDKCVEACVTSHSPGWFDWVPFLRNDGPRDGRSRLFLDGPRLHLYEDEIVKNYLVPSTCRQCKDAVCLVGCPVGSIHKGDNGQIVIEDWCIGCTKCAMNCPYNAIQMHEIGIIPRSSFGWWHRQGNLPETQGATPFFNDRDFRAWYRHDEPIEFTRAFSLSTADAASSPTFMLHIVSSASALSAEVNGTTLEMRKLDDKEAKKQGWNYEAMLATVSASPAVLPGEKPPQPVLRLGNNQMVIRQALANSKEGGTLLDVGLVGYVPPLVDKSIAGDEFMQDWVMSLAVVCDMCSGQPGQRPACVTACPHEAAERRFISYDSFLPAPKD